MSDQQHHHKAWRDAPCEMIAARVSPDKQKNPCPGLLKARSGISVL